MPSRRALVFVGSGVHGELSIASPRLPCFPKQVYPMNMQSGPNHIVMLSADNTVYSAGHSAHGKLGTGVYCDDNTNSFEDIEPFSVIEFINLGVPFSISSVTCGYRSSAAITDTGLLFTWGTLTEKHSSNRPALVMFPKNVEVTQVALGNSHALAIVYIDKKKKVFGWGESTTGAFGTPETSYEEPTELETFNEYNTILSIKAGYDHSGIIVDDRDFYVFGNCDYGLDLDVPSYVPKHVCFMEPGRSKVDLLCLGNRITLMVIEGLVFGFGNGYCDIVCTFLEEPHSWNSSSVHVLYIDKSDPCIALSTSEKHISIVTKKGKGYSCGSAEMGALGNGNSHENTENAMPFNTGHPAKFVACCNGCTYLFVVPPLYKVSLEHIMQYEYSDIPYIAEYLISELEREEHCKTQGIFRTSGDSKVIEELFDMFSVDQIDYEILCNQPTESYAGLLKQFLRQLTTPLIPVANQNEFCDIINEEKVSLGRYNRIYDAVQKIPPIHLALLKKILFLLHKVSQFSLENKMTSKNIVMCFLTAVFGQNIMNHIQRATGASAIFNILIKDAPLWFGEKEKILPAQMTDLLTKIPYLQSVSDTLFLSTHSFDLDDVVKAFIESGNFRKLCSLAMSGFLETEFEFEQFRDILQHCLPAKPNATAIFNAIIEIESSSPKLSSESIESISVLIECIAQSETSELSIPVQTLLKSYISKVK